MPTKERTAMSVARREMGATSSVMMKKRSMGKVSWK